MLGGESAVAQHWDWIGARHASLRAFCVLLGIGTMWAGTGWHAGPFLMLGGSVMISVFSTFGDPAWIMARLLIWQVCGAATSLVLKFGLWTHSGAEWQTIVIVIAGAAGGGAVDEPSPTTVGSMGYAMLLLISQPQYPFTAGFVPTLEQTIAVILGPFIAYCAFLLIFPTTAARRMTGLVEVMRSELRAMASARAVVGNSALWQARFCTRLLKVIRWGGKAGSARNAALEEGFEIRRLGHAIYLLRDLRHKTGVSAGTLRAAEVALARLSRDAGRSEATQVAIERTARRLEGDVPALAATLKRCLHPSVSLSAERRS
ncbi:MAG: FUSC family protein [Breoghania sp.]|nr:FUSC family protein [Breoghania sp.]MDJ0930154.1 FUSC family protein [Breoghania sp.]